MEYGKAQDIRKKGLVGLITENLVKGDSIGSSFGSAISDRTQATITGLQETFDPLNVAKFLTGGSKLAPALLGRLTGRKQSSIEYFAGKRTPRGSFKDLKIKSDGVSDEATIVDALGLIYKELKLAEEDRQILESSKKEEEAENEKLLDDRNKAIIEALTGRKEKIETKKERARAKRKDTKKKSEEKQTEQKTKTKETKDKTKAKREEAVTKKEQQKSETRTKKEEVAKKVETPPAPKEVPPVPKEAPKPVPKPEVKKPPTAAPAPTAKPPVTKIPPVVVSGTKGLVIAALVAAGYSKQAQANVLANVEKESNFRPRSEELEKYSAKTLYKLYGPPGVEGGQPPGGKNRVRFQTIQEAQNIVSQGPVAVGDVIYGGRMGNSEPGDGYKYRGRGFIQITGKENYDKIGKAIGIDLVNNPDLANDPKIAAKIIPAYFKMKIKKPEDLEDIDKVNKAVGSASEQSRQERKTLAATYAAELNIGSQIDQTSKENRELKASQERDKPAPITNNTNVNQTTNTPVKRQDKKEDDRPVIFEKLRN